MKLNGNWNAAKKKEKEKWKIDNKMRLISCLTEEIDKILVMRGK